MDYLRQLRNDEKRCIYSGVTSIGSGEGLELGATTVDVLLGARLPAQSFTSKVFAVVTEAFAAGSLASVGTVDGAGTELISLFSDLDLATEGATIGLDQIGYTSTATDIGYSLNQAGLDSATGLVQIVTVYTEEPATAGRYSA